MSRRDITIEALLHWSFVTECADLDIGDNTEFIIGVGIEYLVLQRAQLGISQIDGGGKSHCHDDADHVAGCVSALGPATAFLVRDMAKIGKRPACMIGEEPRLVPVDVSDGGKSIVWTLEPQVYLDLRLKRRRTYIPKYCPMTLSPTRQQIDECRRLYHRWWEALKQLFEDLRTFQFRDFNLTGQLPPYKPWEIT